jgi:hypothetical protein
MHYRRAQNLSDARTPIARIRLGVPGLTRLPKPSKVRAIPNRQTWSTLPILEVAQMMAGEFGACLAQRPQTSCEVPLRCTGQEPAQARDELHEASMASCEERRVRCAGVAQKRARQNRGRGVRKTRLSRLAASRTRESSARDKPRSPAVTTSWPRP